MLTVSHRAASPADLGALTSGKGSPARNLLIATLPVALVIFGLVYAVSRRPLVAGALAGIFFAASAVSNMGFARDVARRRDAARDERAVEVIDVQASSVVDVEHHGSHGPALVFFAGDGQALLVVGQWLLEQRHFPTLTFALCRWADTKRPIRIESAGKRVRPENSKAKLPSNPSLGDIEIFRAELETLQGDLDRAFPSPAK